MGCVCFVILWNEAENTIYSNLTGRFPIESYAGINHIFVCYVYKLNIILLRTTKNSEDKENISAFKSCYTKFNSKGHHHTVNVLDSKCSQAVKEYTTFKRTNLQFIESHNHRFNATEHGCKATKYHNIAALCTTDPECPTQFWNRVVSKIEAALNMIWTSIINTSKSAKEALNSKNVDWNRTPLAPVGQGESTN